MLKNALIVTYILVVLAISAVARADFSPSNQDIQNYNYKTYVGDVVALENGSLVLALEDQKTFFVLKAQTDISSFVGSKVMVSGIELEHQLAPHYQLEAVDPLPNLSSDGSSIVFFVFGISEVNQ